MMNTNKNIVLSITILLIGLVSCNKDYDSPPVQTLPPGSIITIDSLRNIYSAVDTTIDYSLSIYGVVTADEVSGNIYKTLFVQDETNAIQLDLSSSSDNSFFIGDRVRVDLQGKTITRDNNMLMITELDPDKEIIKQESGQTIVPKVVKIEDLAVSGIYSPYQAQLIQIDSVEFVCNSIFSSWADAITQYSGEHDIIDANNNTVMVRSSGYSSFANHPLPKGNGSLIAVVTQYNGTIQLTVRTPEENIMNGGRFNKCPFLVKDFDDQSLTTGGWTTHLVSGNSSCEWGIYASSNSAAKVSNESSSGNLSCDSWLISPSIDLSGASDPIMYFSSNVNFDVSPNPQLKLLVSTNYDGVSNPANATWTDLTSQAIWDTAIGWGAWKNSGDISLSNFLSSNVHIAYRMEGITSNSCTWEIDNINVKEN